MRTQRGPVASIENGTTEEQRGILTNLYGLSTYPIKVKTPALIVVINVVKYLAVKEVPICL